MSGRLVHAQLRNAGTHSRMRNRLYWRLHVTSNARDCVRASVERSYALECHANTRKTVFVTCALFPWLCVANETSRSSHAYTHAFTGVRLHFERPCLRACERRAIVCVGMPRKHTETVFVTCALFPWLCVANETSRSSHAYTHAFTGVRLHFERP